MVDMDAASPPGHEAGTVRSLLALRHALADPLSSVALKLDLVERRLLAPSGAEPAWVVERVRAAQTDVRSVTRLLDLLLRLAEIAGERPRETSLPDVCRAAGVALHEAAEPVPRLILRHTASAGAVQSVASFMARGAGVPPAAARAALEDGWATLVVEGSRSTSDGLPEPPVAPLAPRSPTPPGRLLDLPHGIPDAEALFVARVAVEADGGRLELTEDGGRLVARFSWPVAAAERKGGV